LSKKARISEVRPSNCCLFDNYGFKENLLSSRTLARWVSCDVRWSTETAL